MTSEKDMLFTLSPQRLIERINGALEPNEDRLTLSGQVQQPVKHPLFPSLESIPVCRVRYDVQQANEKGLERTVGFVFWESGSADGEEDGASYETIKLEMRVPLEIGGQKLPPSTIKVKVETSWFWPNAEQRRDHRRYLLGRTKRDFSYVIPTEWFYRGRLIRE